jgi:hypothetical protein
MLRTYKVGGRGQKGEDFASFGREGYGKNCNLRVAEGKRVFCCIYKGK